ncbi:peptide deformylase [Candidatus Fermentibacteria bacterium]|nr:peptide deformylase [Candidatus Fermentibacteria bacterium]
MSLHLLEGILARSVQHEVDHLHGILIIDQRSVDLWHHTTEARQ